MRQTRLVLMAVGGVLLLCVLALVVTLADYTSHPEVANAHIPPVVGTPPSDGTSQAPDPAPTIPVTTVVVPTATPASAGSDRVRAAGQLTLAQLLQQLQQRRHRRPPG